ncbi:MAG: hypothetical protein HQL97_06830 [Magnetococcales bacterium]|nr:hypothetical protein [Magnetococcales bacterium]
MCLADAITRETVEPLAHGILDWRKQLAPARASTFVFRDNAFADDVTKSNLSAILEQNLPPSALARIRSL